MCPGVARRLITLLLACASTAWAQDPPPAVPQAPLQRIEITDTSIFDADEVAWLLRLRPGAPLPSAPGELADRLARLYHREGYTMAKVEGSFDTASGVLSFRVDEGRVEEFDFAGAPPRLQQRFQAELDRAGVRKGDPYNEPAIRGALRRVTAATLGAFRLEEVRLVERAGKRVLQVPVRRNEGDFSFTTGTAGREDLFSPVDGLAPALGFQAVAYDRGGFNYTYVEAFASWKFGRDDAGYSFGVERPLLSNTRLFLGAEVHDVTASDDMWRITTTEQTLVALTFRNTFRDYYRRRGVQVHTGFRPGRYQEFVASWRWDRHEPLPNETDVGLFRRDREFRPNLEVRDAELGALVLAYTFDSRGLDHESIAERYQRHLVDDLYRAVRRRRPGWRVDWTSEIAGRGLGGDHEFTRHILNARGAIRLGPRQSFAARGLFGWSDGELPVERQLAVGGIGSVHGYRFKESAGAGMTLFNAEYALDFDRIPAGQDGLLRGLLFFDAGRVRDPVRGTNEWMQGIGVGLQTGPVRIEWGFKLDDIPRSRQMIVRLDRGF